MFAAVSARDLRLCVATHDLSAVRAHVAGGIARVRDAVTLSSVIWIVAPLQIASALTLIFLVLLHSGKGGGLSDMFGGGAGAAAAGSTVVERNLDRITVIAAVIFGFTSVAFALIF